METRAIVHKCLSGGFLLWFQDIETEELHNVCEFFCPTARYLEHTLIVMGGDYLREIEVGLGEKEISNLHY